MKLQYFIKYQDSWGYPCATIVKATSKYHAWKKVQRRYLFGKRSLLLHSIEQIEG